MSSDDRRLRSDGRADHRSSQEITRLKSGPVVHTKYENGVPASTQVIETGSARDATTRTKVPLSPVIEPQALTLDEIRSEAVAMLGRDVARIRLRERAQNGLSDDDRRALKDDIAMVCQLQREEREAAKTADVDLEAEARRQLEEDER